METTRKRRSIREYGKKPFSENDINFLLEASRPAPSWANRQCWRYIFVTDETLKKKITHRSWAAQALVVIVGCADPMKSGDREGKPYYMLDMGSSMEHIMLAAAKIDIGTCWIDGQFDEKTEKSARYY